MYLHARSGRFCVNAYYDDVTGKDQFIGGYVGILDQLAARRLSANARKTVRQNFIVIPAMLATGALIAWGIYTGIMHFAPIAVDVDSYNARKSWDNTATVFSMIAAITCLITTIGELVMWDSPGHTPLSRVCDWVIMRPRIISHRVDVDASRALRALATGTCNRPTSGSDRAAVIAWLQAHSDDMPAIRRFVGDSWTRRVEALIESRPSDPTDYDKRQLEAIKAQLDARAATVVSAIHARVDKRSAAATRKSSQADSKWRAEAARLTSDQ